MNLYAFLAVIIACATAITITCILIKSTIRIKIEKDPLTSVAPLAVSVPDTKSTTPIPDQPEKKQEDIAAVSMDAVIAAANELMGITTIGDDNDGGKE